MTKRYTGGVVSSSLPTVNSAGASGVFLLSQQADYQSRNSWPPFKVEESLRFRASATGYLNKTFAAAGNRKTWTWSGWVKRGTLSTNQGLFACWIGAGSTRMWFGFITSTDQITFYGQNGGSTIFDLQTTPVYRDPSAWYHLVLAVDTTQSTSSNRAKIYVNGVQVTAFSTSTYASQNTDTAINSADAHYLGSEVTTSTVFDGYMSEVYFVDGQALTPSSFGATDKDGNWSPIAYTGTYGTNGFYVNFRDNTSATTVGYDYSGNGNNWTLNNFNVSTANTSYDIMIDVPQDQSDGTANNRGNYCTLNPLHNAGTLSNANLNWSGSNQSTHGTIAANAGKYYFEVKLDTYSSGNAYIGISDDTWKGVDGNWGWDQVMAYVTDGRAGANGAAAAYGATYTQGDTIGVAFDITGNTITFYKNGTSQGVAFSTGLLGKNWRPFVYISASSAFTANFGQRPFAYAPPSGFKALNTFNLPEPTIKQPNRQFDAVIWTGDQTNKQIPLNFTADFVWAKRRNNSDNHVLYDALRGVNNGLNSNTNSVEAINNYGLDFDNGNYLDINGSQYFGGGGGSGITFVAWNWNAGGANTTNTSGSITSIVRANPTAGFSVVTYTGTGSNATVGHGLGVAPQMILVKNRAAAGYSWLVYHKFMATSSPATWYMSLNQTSAASNGANVWIDDPTSTVFTVSGSYPEVNGSTNTYVAYCFAPIAGYSAFGSYVGNSSADGTFIYTGFRPAFVLYKKINGIDGWLIYDAKRNSYNVANALLQPDNSGAEAVSGPGSIDILSNGFKHRNANNIGNSSSFTYIYMAFAEMPFKYARAR